MAKAGRQGTVVDLASANGDDFSGVAKTLVGKMVQITNESFGKHTSFYLYQFDDEGNKSRVRMNQIRRVNGKRDITVWVDGERQDNPRVNLFGQVMPRKVGSQVKIKFCLK